jgi:hypothetical protein
LCPFRSHIRDSAAKRESEERTYLSGFVGAPEERRSSSPQPHGNPIQIRLPATRLIPLECTTSNSNYASGFIAVFEVVFYILKTN